MVLDVIVEKTDDGFTAEIPSISGCESWAPDEDEALEKILDLAQYYLNLPDRKEIKLDKARGDFNHKVYKLVFDKV